MGTAQVPVPARVAFVAAGLLGSVVVTWFTNWAVEAKVATALGIVSLVGLNELVGVLIRPKPHLIIDTKGVWARNQPEVLSPNGECKEHVAAYEGVVLSIVNCGLGRLEDVSVVVTANNNSWYSAGHDEDDAQFLFSDEVRKRFQETLRGVSWSERKAIRQNSRADLDLPRIQVGGVRWERALVPERRLGYIESLRIAELQANRLLEIFGIRGPLVPSQLIAELPRFDVRLDAELPVSGSTHWENGRWIITLNASEPYTRRRYSLAHEFKHAIDHTTKAFLYGDTTTDPRAAEHAERAADHFAACLLMPKRWLKSQWVQTQNVPLLAHRLGVSSRALSVRLWYLGMAVQTPRCPRISRPDEWPGVVDHYLRYTPSPLEAA